MKTLHKSMLAAFLAMGLLSSSGLVSAQTPGAAPAANQPTMLAVVNIVELFDKLLEKAAADADIDKMKRDYEDKATKMSQAIQTKQNGLASYKEGTKEYNDLQDEILQDGMNLQAFNSFAQQRLFLELRVRTAGLYNKINAAVAQYATDHGIALVFVADNPSVAGARTQEQLQAMVTVRKLLYYRQDFDITKQILQAMNTSYTLGTTSGAGTPATGRGRP